MADAAPLRVLAVDDDADTRANLCDILEMDGYEVVTAGSIGEDPGCTHVLANPALARLLRVPPGANASPGAPVAERPAYRVVRGGRELAADELPMPTAARGTEVREVELDVVHPDGAVVNLLAY